MGLFLFTYDKVKVVSGFVVLIYTVVIFILIYLMMALFPSLFSSTEDDCYL